MLQPFAFGALAQQAAVLDARSYDRHAQRYRRLVPLDRLLRASESFQGNRLLDAVDRSRWRGLLPTIKFTGRLQQGHDLLRYQAADSGRSNLSMEEQLTASVELRFDLGRLLYTPDERRILKQYFDVRERRHKVRQRLVAAYVQWVELSVRRDLQERITVDDHAKIDGLEGEIDLYANGTFSKMINHRVNAKEKRQFYDAKGK